MSLKRVFEPLTSVWHVAAARSSVTGTRVLSARAAPKMAEQAALLRKINLIEILKEAADEEGRHVPDLTDDQIAAWSEEQIRTHYSPRSCPTPSAVPEDSTSQHLHLHQPAIPLHQQQKQKQQPPATVGSVVQHPAQAAAWPDVPPLVFNTWFPGLKLSGTQQQQPRGTLLCFHSSGNAEDMFTSEGTGARRAPSPLLDWCKQQQVQLLAVQMPGRGQRLKEPSLTSCQQAAQQLLPVVGPVLAQGRPWAVVAHSMGCWLAYELMLAALHSGLPAPVHAFLSAMPGPLTPQHQRPWRQQRHLNEEQFKEECSGWDINEVVFSPGLWEMYQPMLRADFKLFDEYEADALVEQPALSCPITVFWGECDRLVTQALVQGWEAVTCGPLQCHRISGNHLWPLDKAAKQQWLSLVVQQLQGCLAGAGI